MRLLSPLRRSAAREARANRRAIGPVDRAVRNLRVALRRMVVVVEQGAAPHGLEHLPEALDEVAGALFTVPGALRDPDGEGGRRLRAALDAVAHRLDPGELQRRRSVGHRGGRAAAVGRRRPLRDTRGRAAQAQARLV